MAKLVQKMLNFETETSILKPCDAFIKLLLFFTCVLMKSLAFGGLKLRFANKQADN